MHIFGNYSDYKINKFLKAVDVTHTFALQYILILTNMYMYLHFYAAEASTQTQKLLSGYMKLVKDLKIYFNMHLTRTMHTTCFTNI